MGRYQALRILTYELSSTYYVPQFNYIYIYNPIISLFYTSIYKHTHIIIIIHMCHIHITSYSIELSCSSNHTICSFNIPCDNIHHSYHLSCYPHYTSNFNTSYIVHHISSHLIMLSIGFVCICDRVNMLSLISLHHHSTT